MGSLNYKSKQHIYSDPFLLKDLYTEHFDSELEHWQVNTVIEPWYPINVSSKGNVTITIPTKTTQDGTTYLIIRGLYIPLDYVVASTYLANPYDYTVVVHKDGDKSNNDVLNLEWDTDLSHVAPSKPRHLVVTELLSAGICPIPDTEDYLLYKASYDLPRYSSMYNPNTGQYVKQSELDYCNPMPKRENNETLTLEWRYNYIMQRKFGRDCDNRMCKSPDLDNVYLIIRHKGDEEVTYQLDLVKAEQLVESLELNWIKNNPMEAMIDEYVRGSRLMLDRLHKFHMKKREESENVQEEVQKSELSEDNEFKVEEVVQELEEKSVQGMTLREMMLKMQLEMKFLSAGEAFGMSSSVQVEEKSEKVSLSDLISDDKYGLSVVYMTPKVESEEVLLNYNNSFNPVYEKELNYYNSFSNNGEMLNYNNSIRERREEALSEVDLLLVENKAKFYIDPKTGKFGKPPVDRNGNKMWSVPTMSRKEYKHAYYTDLIDEMMSDEEARESGLSFAPPIPPEMRADIYIGNKIKEMKDNFVKESLGGPGDLSILRENMKKFYEIPFPELLERGLRTLRHSKPVAVIMRNGDLKMFNSVGECATYCNVDRSVVTKCCRGKLQEYLGLKFRYLDPRDINEVFRAYLTETDGKLSKNITDLLDKGELEMTPELELVMRTERKKDALKKLNDEKSLKMKELWDAVRRYLKLLDDGELYDEDGNAVMEEPKYYKVLASFKTRKARRTKAQILADKEAYEREHPKRKVGRPKKRGPKKKKYSTKLRRLTEEDILGINKMNE